MNEKEKRTLRGKVFPKYVKTVDGFIGVFRYFDFGEFPVYQFEGGQRVADGWEIAHGSDDREALLSEAIE